jgi:hypothetical protein
MPTTTHNTIKPFERFPVVICPGCKVAMVLKETRPIMFSSDLFTATYRCEQCHVDTKREFKRENG